MFGLFSFVDDLLTGKSYSLCNGPVSSEDWRIISSRSMIKCRSLAITKSAEPKSKKYIILKSLHYVQQEIKKNWFLVRENGVNVFHRNSKDFLMIQK